MKNQTTLMMVIDAMGIPTLEYLLSNHNPEVELPNLSSMGLGMILDPRYCGIFPCEGPYLAFAIEQASATADSVMGHRELMGIVDGRTYELYPQGFPVEYIAELEKMIGRKTFFNRMAGGMEAISLNREHHERTGEPIVYASKCDPLIQIAMNETIIPVEEQHMIADIAFQLSQDMEIPMTRAIARAYVVKDGEVIRTANRHDAVLPMNQYTLIDLLNDNAVRTIAVGKTSDLVPTDYDSIIKLKDDIDINPLHGLRFVTPKDTNPYNIQGTLNALYDTSEGDKFIFTNLVDTDSVYGHTRDVEGALRSLEEIDRSLALIEEAMSVGDTLIITADHGMEHREDYGYHSKEPLPLLVRRIGYAYSGLDIGSRKTLASAGYVAAQSFRLGKEFMDRCWQDGFD